MKIDQSVDGNIVVLRLDGELDMKSAPTLRERLVRAGGGLRPLVVVNIERVTYVDSAGLAVLVGALKEFTGKGGRLLLVAPAPSVRHVLEMTRLIQHFSIHATEAAAVAALG